jgi:prepilin signal peptidase PulO-like enzyme (type II secretory pathway)
MYILAFVFIFLLGTIIGSFLNVVIYRFNTGKPISRGRSICMTCNKTLRWYELIPLFSFLIQGGRCRRCASTISHQYPLVEFGTGLIFALLAFHFVPLLAYSQKTYVIIVTLYALIFSLLMVIAVYDIRHKIIPDTLAYAYAVVALILVFVNPTGVGSLLMTPSIWNVLAGPLCALPFGLLWLISGGRWMGLGDAKLVLGIGWMLGLMSALAALTLSFWIGAIAGILIMIMQSKKLGMRTEIPFAPFLIIGTLIVFIFNLDIFSLARIFHL